jgi:hypothetical protein
MEPGSRVELPPRGGLLLHMAALHGTARAHGGGERDTDMVAEARTERDRATSSAATHKLPSYTNNAFQIPQATINNQDRRTGRAFVPEKECSSSNTLKSSVDARLACRLYESTSSSWLTCALSLALSLCLSPCLDVYIVLPASAHCLPACLPVSVPNVLSSSS